MPIISFPAVFFIGSTILLYTEKVLFDEKRQRLSLHIIVPGIVFFGHIALFFIVPDEMTGNWFKNLSYFHKVYSSVISIAAFIYNIVLILITYSRIIKYKKGFKENFSNDVTNTTSWLVSFVLFNIGIFIIIGFVIAYCIIQNIGIPFTIVEDIILLFIFLFFIYYLITKPEMLPMERRGLVKSDKKYANVNLPDRTRRQYVEKLEGYMMNNQAFLDENISVPQISKVLNIPRHHLSMTINIEFKQNFYSYVNCHRIKYAENLLKDPVKREESILMIAFSSGFQSKTSFNKAFKSLNRMTPSEYRQINCK
jgi:AraC-like DNA-binding protein